MAGWSLSRMHDQPAARALEPNAPVVQAAVEHAAALVLLHEGDEGSKYTGHGATEGSQRAPPALISRTSSVTAAATSNEWQATPLALLGSFRVSLRPCPADRLLLGRRVAAWYDSGQEQGDYRLAHDALKAG
jgi:hypothetical protein